MKYGILFDVVKSSLIENIPHGKRFKSSDLARYVNGFNATDVAYGLSRMNRNGEVRIVDYESSDKVPAGRLRIYERADAQNRLPLAEALANIIGFKEKQLSEYSDEELLAEIKRRLI